MALVRALLVGAILFSVGCCADTPTSPQRSGQRESLARKDINAVLQGHAKEFLDIPGVMGVYVGLLADNKTPCLKVMVVEETEALRGKIPKFVEGYPVVLEKTEMIRPLNE